MADPNIIPDHKTTYLAVIKNSVGSNLFRNLYASVNGQKQDVLEDGANSCAYFMSFVLTGFGWIQKPHATVVSTEKDLQESGWQTIEDHSTIEAGDVIAWEPVDIDGEPHAHIGFAISSTEAISNNWKLKSPQRHDIVHLFE